MTGRRCSQRTRRAAVALLCLTVLLFAESRATTTAMTPAQEVVVGQKLLRGFLPTRPISEDPELADRVERVGDSIAAVSDRPDLPYRFLVVDPLDPGEDYQAWAFLGGAVAISESLVRLCESDDELAFVLGHELAHSTLRHEVGRLRIETVADLDDEETAELVVGLMGSFAREQETEADRYGALYAVRAGYRFTASHETLERIARLAGKAASDAEHPDFASRVVWLKTFRETLEKSRTAFDLGVTALRNGRPDEAIEMLTIFNAEFPQSVAGQVNLGAAHLAKVRAGAGTAFGLAEPLPILPDPGITIRGHYSGNDLNDARRHFQGALAIQSRHATALAGLALVDLRVGRPASATERLQEALAVEPNSPDFTLCLGNARFVAEDYRAAADRYEAALELRKDWSAARKNLALAYERLGMGERARELWTLLRSDPRYRAEAVDHLERLEVQVPMP